MTIKKLNEKEVKYIQQYQAAWQIVLKKSLLENGINSNGLIVLKSDINDFATDMTNNMIKLGMQWLKKDV